MEIDELRTYCIAKPGVTEVFPFGPDVLVFKVLGKMFALVSLAAEKAKVSLKCAPDRGIELRETYFDRIQGAYHMNKKHWNSLDIEQLPSQLVCELTDHSYALVVEKLTKKQRAQLLSSE